MGSGLDSRQGHKELWIYLALVCLVNITGKVSVEGDIRSVTVSTLFLWMLRADDSQILSFLSKKKFENCIFIAYLESVLKCIQMSTNKPSL